VLDMIWVAITDSPILSYVLVWFCVYLTISIICSYQDDPIDSFYKFKLIFFGTLFWPIVIPMIIYTKLSESNLESFFFKSL